MRSVVFDTGPIISLATNNLLWILEPLREGLNGEFIIPAGVKKELIDRPLLSKRFKFEAMQVLSYMNKGVLKMMDIPQAGAEAQKLLSFANSSFMAHGRWIQLVHPAEIEAVALAVHLKSSAFAVDERTTRLLIEEPEKLHKIMERKLHTKIRIDRKNLNAFRKASKGLNLIRSTELVAAAYEKGLLDRYLPDIPDARKELLDSALWGVKLNGCSISEHEIKRIVSLQTRKR